MDSLISTFHIDWQIILAQLVNFAIVFFVLYRFALKPLKKLMDERSQTIASGLQNAEKQEELLKASQLEYDKTLTKARAEAQEIMKEVKKDADLKRAELLEKAQGEVSVMIANGKKQLESDKTKMLEDAKKEIVSIIMSATEKIVGESITGKVEQKLVEDSIKNI